MLRSKDIEDYFDAAFEALKPGDVLPFDMHLYFSQNRHIMVWRRKGEALTDAFIDKYRSRGMERFWIYSDDRKAYEQYVGAENSEKDETPAAPESPHSVDPEIPAQTYLAPVSPLLEQEKKHEPRSEAGQKLAELLRNPEIDDRSKIAKVALAARKILAKTAKPDTHEAQSQAMEKARDAVRDILDMVYETASDELKSLCAEIFKLANVEPQLEHGVNVSTYSVLFAMAFGRIDESLLTDIAMASLLHDVGMCQISASITPIPCKKQDLAQRDQFERHVNMSAQLIAAYGAFLPERVKTVLIQHHEKFDGTGFPKRLKGFEIDDIAQLLGMSDLIETVASGQWDGERRTLKATLQMLEALEKNRTFPEHFNPEVFAAIMRWVRSTEASQAAKEAAQIVELKARELLKHAS